MESFFCGKTQIKEDEKELFVKRYEAILDLEMFIIENDLTSKEYQIEAQKKYEKVMNMTEKVEGRRVQFG